MLFKINITISSVLKCGIINAIYTLTLFSWLRFSEKLFHSSNKLTFHYSTEMHECSCGTATVGKTDS